MQLRERSDLSFAPRSSFLLGLPFLSPSQCSVCMLRGEGSSESACMCMCPYVRAHVWGRLRGNELHPARSPGIGPQSSPPPPGCRAQTGVEGNSEQPRWETWGLTPQPWNTSAS